MYELIKTYSNEIENLIRNEWNPKVKFKMIFISSKDEDKAIDWSSDSEWENYNPEIAYLFVVNEVAKRSTEWRCQPYLSWYHTHRPKGAKNTKDQDQERPVYYEKSFEKLQPPITADEIDFTIYGDKGMAEVSAELKSITQLDEYTRTGVKISGNATAKHKSKQINEIDWDYNFDSKIKKKILKSHPIFNKNIEYTSRKQHPNKRETLPTNWVISDKLLEKYKKFIGFRLTNIRGDLAEWLINVCIKGEILEPPIKYRRDIEKDKNEGLSGDTKVRRNIYYANGETNPNNYKFCLRTNKETISICKIKNKSMFN